MKQLVLDIRPDAPPTLDNFVIGDNDELVAALRDFAAPRSHEAAAPPHLYLWGPDGSGRSHLLRATVAAAAASGLPARHLAADALDEALPETGGMLLAVDDAERIAPAGQIALFNAFNRARSKHQRLLVAGSAAPLQLNLREDLRTRIGQCLVFEIRPLDDAARAAILATLAERRGLKLAGEVTEFLLRHGHRDLPSLLSVLDALDAASLERKRAVTLPLLREMMQAGLDI